MSLFDRRPSTMECTIEPVRNDMSKMASFGECHHHIQGGLSQMIGQYEQMHIDWDNE